MLRSLYSLALSILSLSLYPLALYTYSRSLCTLSLSLYSRSLCTLSLSILSLSLYPLALYTLALSILSRFLYSRALYTLSLSILSRSLYSLAFYTLALSLYSRAQSLYTLALAIGALGTDRAEVGRRSRQRARHRDRLLRGHRGSARCRSGCTRHRTASLACGFISARGRGVACGLPTRCSARAGSCKLLHELPENGARRHCLHCGALDGGIRSPGRLQVRVQVERLVGRDMGVRCGGYSRNGR